MRVKDIILSLLLEIVEPKLHSLLTTLPCVVKITFYDLREIWRFFSECENSLAIFTHVSRGGGG